MNNKTYYMSYNSFMPNLKNIGLFKIILIYPLLLYSYVYNLSFLFNLIILSEKKNLWSKKEMFKNR